MKSSHRHPRVSSHPPLMFGVSLGLHLGLGLGLAACTKADAPTSAPTSRPQGSVQYPPGHYAPNTEQKADTPFVRFADKGDGEGVLETAIATYEGEKGEKVELISAVHIADRAYYERLAKLFTSYDSLLYEMVKPAGAKPPAPGHKTRDESSSMVSWFQRFLRDTLALEFQLDAIDYRAKNFVHADLTTSEYTKLSEERGETLLQLMFKLALSQYKASQDGTAKSDPNMGLKLIAAMFMPDSQRALKYLFAKELQNMEAMMAGLGEGKDGEGSVLLIGRNKKLMRVLRERLRKGDKKIGVFYGGAHLSDVEKRIFKEIGLRRTGVRWEKAWDVKRQPTKPKATNSKATNKGG